MIQKITNWKDKWISTWRKYPICVLGYNIERWENGDVEYYFPEYRNRLLFMKVYNDKAPTHLQYTRKYGFLLEWPLCFHIWYQIRPQQVVANPNALNDPSNPTLKVPGSERVLYFRIGLARWDTDGYHLPTFYIGGHFD